MAGRFVIGAFVVLSTLGIPSGCSHGDADESAGGSSQQDRAPTETTAPPVDDPFLELRARPLRAKALRPGEYCPNPSSRDTPIAPGIPAEVARGTGPVYVAFPGIPRFLDFFPPSKGSPAARSKWRGAEVVWASHPSYRGPVLVRGRQVDGRRRVGFGRGVLPEFELRLPAGNWTEASDGLRVWGRVVRPQPGWRVAIAPVRVRAEGCYLFQIDGTSFSEPGILFGVIWQP